MNRLPPEETESRESWREVRYRHSPSFCDVLSRLEVSLLISTYQAGKLVAVGTANGRLEFSFHQFDQAMGVAVSRRRIAVGAKGQIWLLENEGHLAPSLEPAGQFDACYLARSAHVTGGIQCHEMAWSDPEGSGGELWVVNTLFSCLATLDPRYSFVPRWQPPFISQLAGEDRCHLNGLAIDDGRPAYVTLLAESNAPAGWRPTKNHSGCVLDVASGQVVAGGMAMPHSPRIHDGRLWVLDSGQGSLEAVDRRNGQRERVASMPGFTRGLAFHGPLAFVGLSRIRETAVFGGVPIAEQREGLKCGIGVVDIHSGQTVATFEFESGVEEIFDVQILPRTRCVALRGPRSDQDSAHEIWVVPRPEQVAALLKDHSRQGVAQDLAPQPLWSQQMPREDAVSGIAGGGRLVERALSLLRERRVAEAIAMLEQAAAAEPESAEILNHLGNALQDAGRQEDALGCYQRAVEADPSFVPALQNLGYVLVAQGRTDEGIDRLSQAGRVKPSPLNRLLVATALPIVYASLDELRRRRATLVAAVEQLVKEGVSIDTTCTLVPTNFYAAYQGENDRDLHANLGKIYQGLDLCGGRKIDASNGRLKVGFLSAYFRDHTIGRLNIGRIERLPRADFSVTVLSVGPHADEMAQRFRRAADRYVVLPRDVAEARRLIADEKLDILLFTDVGMDALTYTLAFSRMAPLQSATWGHPVTTGSPSIDCFLSSRLLETEDADPHYTERLVRLPSLGTYYERPRRSGPYKRRADLGLPEDRHLYLCPQTLFKFHPEFDAILEAILRSDPLGELVLIEGRAANWTRLLQQRFARTMPAVIERIRWLTPLSNPDFLDLLAMGDVVLDPIHFGGGNTTYEALAMGTPVVSWPSPLLRGRITLALATKLGWPDGIVRSAESYAATAVRFACDQDHRETQRAAILDRSDRLFDDAGEIDDLAQALREMASA